MRKIRDADHKDIWDAYGHGARRAEAIRDFLRDGWESWGQRPRYVVLAGAGHLDYRDGLGLGGNLIPPLAVMTGGGLVASDTLLGDVDGDGRPEIAVGRVPVVSRAEMRAFASKMKGRDSSLWELGSGQLVMVADNDDGQGTYSADSDAILADVAGFLPTRSIYLGRPYSVDEVRAAFIDAVNGGARYVNLMGHGGLTAFGFLSAFGNDYAPVVLFYPIHNRFIRPK